MDVQNATPATKQAPRRQKSSKPNIYFRQDRKGQRRYEFVYRDVNGKQRWVGGFGTIKEAEDARGEVMRRIRRGERVGPIKATLVEFAHTWLGSQTALKPSTRARYEWAIRQHTAPRFGKLKLGEVTEDHVAGVISDMQREGYKPATIKAVLGPLSLILDRAVRRGAISANPVATLERSERPRGEKTPMRILSREEISAFLGATAAEHRTLAATLLFAGLRIGEALGLRWADVDLDSGHLHIRGQFDHKTRERTTPKTESSARSVILMPALAKMLAAHRLSSPFSDDSDCVFPTIKGTPQNRDNFRSRVFRPAVKAAGIDREGVRKLRTHELRHTFASMLIAGGASVVFLSKQMGHSSPSVTLDIYGHLFDERDHGARMSAILEDGFGNVLETAGRGDAQADAVAGDLEPAPLRSVAGGRG